MKTTNTIIQYPVDVRALRLRLSGKDKMPMDFQCSGGTYLLFSRYYGKFLGAFEVVVTKGTKNSSKHRVFVKYEGRLIPAGRLHQAKP